MNEKEVKELTAEISKLDTDTARDILSRITSAWKKTEALKEGRKEEVGKLTDQIQTFQSEIAAKLQETRETPTTDPKGALTVIDTCWRGIVKIEHDRDELRKKYAIDIRESESDITRAMDAIKQPSLPFTDGPPPSSEPTTTTTLPKTKTPATKKSPTRKPQKVAKKKGAEKA